MSQDADELYYEQRVRETEESLRQLKAKLDLIRSLKKLQAQAEASYHDPRTLLNG